MNFSTNDSLAYYKLGEFVASTMLNGIINTDMQLENIGVNRNNSFVFRDYANVKK